MASRVTVEQIHGFVFNHVSFFLVFLNPFSSTHRTRKPFGHKSNQSDHEAAMGNCPRRANHEQQNDDEGQHEMQHEQQHDDEPQHDDEQQCHEFGEYSPAAKRKAAKREEKQMEAVGRLRSSWTISSRTMSSTEMMSSTEIES